MVHRNNILKVGVKVPEKVNEYAKPNEVKDDVKTIVVAIDVRPQFTNEMTFTSRQHLLEWIPIEASKFGFGVLIVRSDNDSSRRQAFVVMTCERGGKYVPKVRTLKHTDMGSRKSACPFKLRVSCRVDGLCRFSVVCGIHNHALDTKLQGNSIVCWLKPEEKESILELSIIKVASRNILAHLKRKRPQIVSNIRKIYNERYQLNIATRGLRSKMQQLLKLLDNN
ncbi:uncharacterized protein LOC131641949 [Vicia villosa]|uniref:uncharacterized protein LOC131641949 n=1 Tax=Vicia villosa TaxID=3911 RepID=UPI00273B6100|nr:uncharacterized protein LOC131641949 [Vicia villosa]